MEDFNVKVEIPKDDEGYSLLQCPNCGEFFKLTSSDVKDDGVLSIYCPSCGLAGETYITEDVLDLALKKVKNKMNDDIYKQLKAMEQKHKNGFISIKVGKPPKHEYEEPLRSGVEALQIATYRCCHKTAKIKPLLIITGSYCPFCGVKNYETE